VAGILGQWAKRETLLNWTEKRLKDAEAKLRRHQAVIDAGVDPAALIEPMNHAHAGRQDCQGRASAPARSPDDRDVAEVVEVYAMLDQLGDVARHLNLRTIHPSTTRPRSVVTRGRLVVGSYEPFTLRASRRSVSSTVARYHQKIQSRNIGS
jgi:hypothetical protein